MTQTLSANQIGAEVVTTTSSINTHGLAIDGTVETDGDVHHLIAKRVFDFSELVENLESRSRDFC